MGADARYSAAIGQPETKPMFTRTKWPALLVRVAMLVIGLIETPALAATPASPVGNWSTTNGRGVIAIDPCGDSLCGRIVGIERSATDPMPTDVAGHSQCGLTLIPNQKTNTDRAWVGEVPHPPH